MAIMTPFSCIRGAVAAAALTICACASAQTALPLTKLVGEYNLASSATVPASTWGYSKGRISVKQLDERHLLIALSCDSREEVDQMVAKALAAGGTAPNPIQDHGFMYSHGFTDLDGHVWEVFYMDLEAAPKA